MKRVVSIQDLSCLGKCSLTVALPVLSAMGCACTVLPTAVLSTHTGFPNPRCQPLTDDILPIASHWKSIGADFDAIAVGYLADPHQTDAVLQVLELFDKPVVLDPVMGDHGTLYSGKTKQHVQSLRQLCCHADFLLPNLTEAALLTGLSYREQPDSVYLDELTAGLMALGVEAAVITGLRWDESTTGFAGAHRDTGAFSYRAAQIPRALHGTGDLFAAVFTGSLVSGRNVYASAELAARFVEKVVAATPEKTPFGTEFESQLPWLWKQLQR